MIITRTPLRVSLVGGGTDMPAFFTRQYGAVVSFAINKYVYVSVNPKFDGKIRLSYSKLEEVETLDELKHDIARETLRNFDTFKKFDTDGVEITSVSDIPGSGTGLGSSSAYAVGLGLALRAYKGWSTNQHPALYAKEAYGVERESCGHPVGKQDHYAAAYGDLHYFRFNEDDTVTAELLPLDENKIHWLEETLMLFYTGRSRSADLILKDQEENLTKGEGAFHAGIQLRDMADRLRAELRQGIIENVGEYLNDAWRFKKRLSGGVTMTYIDAIYDKAVGAGAIGGKICGAGGGGFMLFSVPQGRQLAVEKALAGLQRMPFKIEKQGSCVVYAQD